MTDLFSLIRVFIYLTYVPAENNVDQFSTETLSVMEIV